MQAAFQLSAIVAFIVINVLSSDGFANLKINLEVLMITCINIPRNFLAIQYVSIWEHSKFCATSPNETSFNWHYIVNWHILEKYRCI